MRQVRWILGLLVLAGCDSRVSVVARVGDRTLSVDRLAELMVLAQPVPLSREVAEELARHWVHLMAFAERMAGGDSLLDRATIHAIMWLPIRQGIAAEWRRRLLDRAGLLGDAVGTARFDSTHAAALLRDRRVLLHGGAADVTRRVAEDPWRPNGATTVLATFRGGSLTAADFAHYVQYLAPSTRLEMRSAGAERIAEFLLGLVLQEILVAQAESAGVALDPSALAAIEEQCRGAVHLLWDRTGLSPAALKALETTEAGRRDVAARNVEAYLDAAAARRAVLEAVPPFLAVPLLRGTAWTIVPGGLEAAVEQAQRLLAATRN